MAAESTVRLITLGCAKNEVDSEEIAGVLQRAGYQLDAHTPTPERIERADVYDLFGVPSGILSPLEAFHGKRSELSGRSAP